MPLGGGILEAIAVMGNVVRSVLPVLKDHQARSEALRGALLGIRTELRMNLDNLRLALLRGEGGHQLSRQGYDKNKETVYQAGDKATDVAGALEQAYERVGDWEQATLAKGFTPLAPAGSAQTIRRFRRICVLMSQAVRSIEAFMEQEGLGPLPGNRMEVSEPTYRSVDQILPGHPSPSHDEALKAWEDFLVKLQNRSAAIVRETDVDLAALQDDPIADNEFRIEQSRILGRSWAVQVAPDIYELRANDATRLLFTLEPWPEILQFVLLDDVDALAWTPRSHIQIARARRGDLVDQASRYHL
jgi:hypothetical protein